MNTAETVPGSIYLVDQETHNTGIPYAESFYVGVHFCIAKVAKNSTRLAVYGAVKYKKTVWGLVKSE